MTKQKCKFTIPDFFIMRLAIRKLYKACYFLTIDRKNNTIITNVIDENRVYLISSGMISTT